MNTNTQSDLTQILDEMEAVTEETKDAAQMQATCVIQHPLLVKALRRAMLGLHPVVHGKAIQDITAILNQGRKTETLEEKGDQP
jgi:hypothetical protein